MSTKVEGESNSCIFHWNIQNISNCWWMQDLQKIESPTFIADALKGTKWCLVIYSITSSDLKNADPYVIRKTDCNGPEYIAVKCQLTMNKSRSLIILRKEMSYFKKGCTLRFSKCRIPKKFRSKPFFPEDTLTVECKLWNSGVKLIKPKHLYARTVCNTNRRCFVLRIDKFSTLESGFRNKLKDSLFDFDLVFNGDGNKKVSIDFISFHDTLKYISFNISIIHSNERKEICKMKKYFSHDLKKGLLSSLLTLPGNVTKNKALYLPNDVLSLEFDCFYSTIEHFGCNEEFDNLENKGVVKRNEFYDGVVKSGRVSVLTDDLKLMFSDAIFSDTELRTSTRTFPAHKNILSARSPVFRKMFSDAHQSDTKEMNNGHVDVTDLEDDTLHRMLLYLYTDSLVDLQFESASKLYSAADKYQIPSLKSKCSSFLKDSLLPKRACNVLILADQHQDDDLKRVVQSYILEHNAVFKLREWKHLMDSNLKVAADTMYKKIMYGQQRPVQCMGDFYYCIS